MRSTSIALLVYHGVQILDVTGPAAVFGAANDALGQAFYRVRILSPDGGAVQSNCAVQLATEPLRAMPPRSVDLLLIAGGDATGLQQLAANAAVHQWVVRASAKCRRFGSVCTGTFLLARFGLIKGKRVATHWSACSMLAARYPDIEVDANALYVEDGQVWTSAGVTTGIDMCLAIVERDLGATIANAIAKRLVLYARRPGYQSQFSPILHAQARAGAPFAELVDWMEAHLAQPLDVPQLAARAAMSERTFHRKFTKSLDETPARFVEKLRLDRVRYLLGTPATLKEIAAKTGFSTPAQLAQAFERRFGITPLLFREAHCNAPSIPQSIAGSG
jgi:transcriptional regulator GlxA family with amidase domain